MKYILYISILIFLNACGGGGSSSSSSNESKDIRTKILDDQFSNHQWHREKMAIDELNKDYTAYNPNTKKSIIVQVVDDGVDAYHEDLIENLDLNNSYNVNTGLNDPTPQKNYEHGTKVAGLIAAVGYNNIGLKGIAPSAKINAFTLKTTRAGFQTDIQSLEKAWFSGKDANNIAISNNSWGSCISKDEDEEEILKKGAEELRDKKGRVFIFSGGNDRDGGAKCPNQNNVASSNTSYLTNSQYTIAVAAVNENNKYASYSSPGANILVSAYSGDKTLRTLATTVPRGTSKSEDTWSEDSKRNYTNKFSGTSAAAPIVSGSLALVLQACPNLSYRDIKYLIAKTATKIDLSNSSWITNNAGLSHSNDYGFGLINPKAMIQECKNSYVTLKEKRTSIASNNISSEITNNLEKTIEIKDDLNIEWVGLTLNTNYQKPSSLQIKLISPWGTQSELIHSNNQFNDDGINLFLNSGFRFSSQTFMKEKSKGVWKIRINTTNSGNYGEIKSLNLEIVGH